MISGVPAADRGGTLSDFKRDKMIYYGDAMEYINETSEVIRELSDSGKDMLADAAGLIKGEKVSHLILIGTGSSFNAACAAVFSKRKKFGTGIQVFYPAEFRDILPLLSHDTLVAGISQQGTSTAVIEAVEDARRAGFRTLAVTGEEETPLKKAADAEMLTPCGYEDAGATTKGYTATTLALMMLSEAVLSKTVLSEATLPEAMLPETVLTEAVPTVDHKDSADVDIRKLCAAVERGLTGTDTEIRELSGKLASAEELIILISDGLKGHLPEIVLKFSEMCRISVRGYTADEFVHGIYNSVTERSVFLFLQYGNATCTEVRLQEYYREKGFKVLTFAGEQKDGCIGLEFIPLLQKLCVLTSREKGININIPKDPDFHRIIGSKKESRNVCRNKE
ncbi:MAG TPA: hypothetical protein DCG37_06310 [Lachnospiraceae bacterium]|nr:hypothetical protein [Lachnospiraceae bacterium]